MKPITPEKKCDCDGEKNSGDDKKKEANVNNGEDAKCCAKTSRLAVGCHD